MGENKVIATVTTEHRFNWDDRAYTAEHMTTGEWRVHREPAREGERRIELLKFVPDAVFRGDGSPRSFAVISVIGRQVTTMALDGKNWVAYIPRLGGLSVMGAALDIRGAIQELTGHYVMSGGW